MGTKLGDAGRARKLAKLLEAWRRAFDARDAEAIARARRSIDKVAADTKPRAVAIKEEG